MWTGPVWVTVLALVLCLAGVLVAVKISRKAKPLGNLPYRWGLYLGIAYGMGGFIYLFLGIAAIGKGAVSEGVGFLILTILMEISAVGTCRRRRWGVIVLIATQAVIGVLPPLLKAIDEIPNALNQAANGQHVTQKALVQALGALVLLIVNVVYFKKRWTLLGMSASSLANLTTAAPSVATYAEPRPRKGIIYTESELEAMRERPTDV